MVGYPNAETALCDWFADNLPTGPTATFRRWLTEIPTNLLDPAGVPCVVLERFGGADDIPGLDIARINIDVFTFGPDPQQARAAALARGEDIRRAIRVQLPGQMLGLFGPVVSKVAVISAPTIRPYDSRGQLRRSQAAYQISLHAAI